MFENTFLRLFLLSEVICFEMDTIVCFTQILQFAFLLFIDKDSETYGEKEYIIALMSRQINLASTCLSETACLQLLY